MLSQSQNELQNCCNFIKEQKITKIKEVYLWKFVGAVCYYVKNLWVHAPAAPILTQALDLNITLQCLFQVVKQQKMGTLQFHIPDFQNDPTYPNQKEFLKFCEGNLKYLNLSSRISAWAGLDRAWDIF